MVFTFTTGSSHLPASISRRTLSAWTPEAAFGQTAVRSTLESVQWTPSALEPDRMISARAMGPLSPGRWTMKATWRKCGATAGLSLLELLAAVACGRISRRDVPVRVPLWTESSAPRRGMTPRRRSRVLHEGGYLLQGLLPFQRLAKMAAAPASVAMKRTRSQSRGTRLRLAMPRCAGRVPCRGGPGTTTEPRRASAAAAGPG